ncbi:MAG: hypothetical protein MJ238_02440 [Bacilli bacterium]|nr:hypothetical protein [Bacilli bacterium]
MKKTKLALLLLPLVLVACGGNGGDNSESKNNSSEDTTSETCDPTTPTAGAWSTNVYLPNGAPAYAEKGRVRVMWCVPGAGGACTTPVYTDCNGYGEMENLNLPAASGYLAHCAWSAKGFEKEYAYNPNGYIVTAANKHADIYLSEVLSYASGEGTVSAPYAVGEGAYKTALKKDGMTYVVVSGITGNFKIESWSEDANAVMSVAEYSNGSAVASGTTTDGNFSYSFEMNAGDTKVLGIKLDNNPYASGEDFEFAYAISKVA